MIGRALNGRYELAEILGVGGMATVWRGHDRVLGRSVAVKVLNGGLADDPRFAERFGREAQHAAMLVHPRIVMVFDSGVDQGSPYIVMELVHGRSLSQLLAENGRNGQNGRSAVPGMPGVPGMSGALPVERAVGIAAAVCEALGVAHAAGLVHRDIKPGNIMISDDGGVKVVDFGIARASSSSSQLTQTATVLGTAAYLSPEQATAAEVDGRADLYALGCVLVEMLTGEPPFTAEAPVAIAFKHVSEQPTPVSLRRPDIPPALDAAVLRLLAKNPGDRPADAAAARAELLAAVPVAAAQDRTAELLAATQALPPVTLPFNPFPAAQGFAAQGAPAHSSPAYVDRAYVDPQRTSVLPPLPPLPPVASYVPQSDRVRVPRRNPLVPVGIGVAVLVGAAAIAAFAFGGSPAGGTKAGQAGAAPAVHGAAATSSAQPPAPAKASPSSSSPASTAKPGPAGALAALRAAVEQAQFTKERDKQSELLGYLDDAAAALADHQPQDADPALRNAQRLIRDLAKKHAIDGATAQNWQSRLNSLLGASRPQSSLPSPDPGQQDQGDGGPGYDQG
ncbi:protein kinase [Kitasatospora sp. MAP5-34]|uniref:protein kinase domain-containing protein n=1 Tax=Kitasatospora sp. MAP5-34 TaxID=3035102 RepID=UPI0024763A02|nr:protein kinase [Kitasatospora sp. MAP5-34]MDH6578954.1 serine/threonine protein kinase/ribosomal protein S20 [Kitasatospora sp. MAP5-34]